MEVVEVEAEAVVQQQVVQQQVEVVEVEVAYLLGLEVAAVALPANVRYVRFSTTPTLLYVLLYVYVHYYYYYCIFSYD